MAAPVGIRPDVGGDRQNAARTTQQRSPKMVLEIAGEQYDRLSEYAFDSDLLNMGDPFSACIPDPTGKYADKVKLGDEVKVHFIDPDINGGERVKMMTGIVTRRRVTSDPKNGSNLLVAGNDIGWHLANCDAPLWMRLRGVKWEVLLNRAIHNSGGSKDKNNDPKWNFKGVRFNGDDNRRLKQGRAGYKLVTQGDPNGFIPLIVVEVGEKWADLLIRYARRDRLLVNCSSDGYLQLYKPLYDQPASYAFEHRRFTDQDHKKNNVKLAFIDENIDGIFTKTVVVGSVLWPNLNPNIYNPGEGKFRGTFQDTTALPFQRIRTLSDAEPLSKRSAVDRARWYHERGLFDSWAYEVTVRGHGQVLDGQARYFAVDTLATVTDKVNRVDGTYYVTRVRFCKTFQDGTYSVVTMRKPRLLSGF